jgi:hypothetical protein
MLPTSLIAKLLTAALAVLLALPTGWCCTVAGAVKAGETHAGRAERTGGCCGSKHRSESSHHAPSDRQTPAAKCCCDHDALRPADGPLLDDGAAAPVAELVMPPPSVALVASDVKDVPERPPHRLLHCVWRC